jgi:hypothetical protein
MTHQFKAGEKARIVELRGFDESAGYKVDDIIIIDRIKFPEPAYKDKKGCWFYSDQLAPVLEVGDSVECITLKNENYAFISKGNTYIIEKVSKTGELNLHGIDWHHYDPELFKLIKKGGSMCGQEKSLRDRIEVLTGWDKEGEEIFQKVKGGYYLQMNNLSDTSGRFMINPTYKTPYMDFMNNTYEVQFAFQSSCEKLRAFKDALLWLLDKSGIEKSKVREGLEAEVKELKNKLAGLERKIEEVGK